MLKVQHVPEQLLDVTITPVGAPVRWQQDGHSLVLLLRLAPGYVRAVAGDECALDPDRFEIRAVFAQRDPTIEISSTTMGAASSSVFP